MIKNYLTVMKTKINNIFVALFGRHLFKNNNPNSFINTPITLRTVEPDKRFNDLNEWAKEIYK